MNHGNLLWWAGLCAKCKWCFRFPPGVNESPDSHRPQLSWWYRHIRGGTSWLNILGSSHPMPPNSPLFQISHWASFSRPVWKSLGQATALMYAVAEPVGSVMPSVPPSPHSQLLSPSSSFSNPHHIIQKGCPQRLCQTPLLASSHHSRHVAAHPSTHWLSPWW